MQFLENVIVAVGSFGLVLLTNIGNCYAQGMPTSAQIAEQQKKMGEALNQVPVTIKATDRLAPSFDKGIQLPKVDPSEIARRYSNASKPNTGADLMIFVSLTMPSDVLMELSKQAKQMGATLVMRGFNGDSMTKTQEIIQTLNAGGALWQVNPDAFKVFKIKTVPAFVLATAGASSILEEGCAKPINFAMVNGNQSIEVALQTIRRKSTNRQLVAEADNRLTKIK